MSATSLSPGLQLDGAHVFACVVEAKSFRGAARALGVPKSTVSARIARLEEHLATRLLERTTRSLRLTDAGAAYYEKIAPALDLVREAERSVGATQAEPTGRLRVTAAIELGQIVFGDVLSEYMRRHPSVEVTVELVDRYVDLVKEGFDLALRAGPLPDSTLIARKLGPLTPIVLFASPAYLARKGAPRTPRDLEKHDCLVMSAQRRATTWTFLNGRRTIDVTLQPRASVNSFVVLRALAIAGHGIVRAPRQSCRVEVEEGQLVPLLEGHALPAAQLHAVYPSSRNVAPKLRAMLDLLEDWFAKEDWSDRTRRRS